MKLIVLIVFTIVAIAFFAFALHISRYKKRKSGCGGGTDIAAGYSSKTCDKDESKSCICE
jgi:hypothetical protein